MLNLFVFKYQNPIQHGHVEPQLASTTPQVDLDYAFQLFKHGVQQLRKYDCCILMRKSCTCQCLCGLELCVCVGGGRWGDHIYGDYTSIYIYVKIYLCVRTEVPIQHYFIRKQMLSWMKYLRQIV